MSLDVLQTLVAITDAIRAATDRDQLLQALSTGVRALGFDSFHLSSRKPNRLELVVEPTLTTFPEAFLRDYDRLGWAEVDPITERVFASRGRFVWNTLDYNHPGPRKQSFVDFMRSLEMFTWMISPTHHADGTVSGMAMLSLTPHLVQRKHQLAAAIVADAALAKAEMLGLCPGLSRDEAITLHLLSEPQMEVLNWMAEGKSNSVIATITGNSERAVRYHASEILRKLGVATRQQAIAIYRASASSLSRSPSKPARS